MPLVVAVDGDVAARYAEREQLTQALPYAATLQDRGWACLFVGASFLILRAKDGGVFARMQRPRAIDLGILKEILGRTGVSRLLVEPALAGDLVAAQGERTPWRGAETDVFTQLGWTPSSHGIAHSKTLVVDLAPPMPEVVAGFSTVARRNTRKAEGAGVTYGATRFDAASARDVEEIRALYDRFLADRDLANEWSFRARLTAHFGGSGWYITAHNAGGLVGVVYLLAHDRIGYYYAAFTDSEARQARVPTGLVHQAMKHARATGCDLFDFVGIRDERVPNRNASWTGFTEFKSRFGGKPIALPPAYEAVT